MDNLFLLLVFLAGFCALLGLGAFISDTLRLFYEARRLRRRIRSITSYGETSGE